MQTTDRSERSSEKKLKKLYSKVCAETAIWAGITKYRHLHRPRRRGRDGTPRITFLIMAISGTMGIKTKTATTITHMTAKVKKLSF